MGQIKHGLYPAQIWQMDYIGRFPSHYGKIYVCTVVDTFSAFLVAHPHRRATQQTTIKTLGITQLYFGTPQQIQSDNGTHFTGKLVQCFAKTHHIEWIYHILYYPQAADLIERMNALLKPQLKRLGPLTKWMDNLEEATKVLNNRAVGNTTPQQRMLGITGFIAKDIKKNILSDTPPQHWKISPSVSVPYRATEEAAGVDLTSTIECIISPGKQHVIPTGIGLIFPPNTFGLLVAHSEWSLKGIQVLGGVIDPDYQGEIKFILYSSALEPFKVTKYDCIGQLLLLPLPHRPIVESTGPTIVMAREAQGFGSTNSRWKPGMKVWVRKPPHSEPRAAEAVAQGTSATVALMYPNDATIYYVPKTFLSLSE
nr:uncharacterized protein LOC123281943 [Equus asinus]